MPTWTPGNPTATRGDELQEVIVPLLVAQRHTRLPFDWSGHLML